MCAIFSLGGLAARWRQECRLSQGSCLRPRLRCSLLAASTRYPLQVLLSHPYCLLAAAETQCLKLVFSSVITRGHMMVSLSMLVALSWAVGVDKRVVQLWKLASPQQVPFYYHNQIVTCIRMSTLPWAVHKSISPWSPGIAAV